METGKFIEKTPNCRRFAISDIHGFYKTLNIVLDKIGLDNSDQLFLLGDFFDRGKQGKEVLDLIIDLQEKGYGIYPLRGNHEQMLLDAHYKRPDHEMFLFFMEKRGKGIRDDNLKIFPEYLKFIEDLPYFYELDNFYLVHAGFDFSKPEPFHDTHSMLWLSAPAYNEEKLKGKTLIHGHIPAHIDVIIENAKIRAKMIGIDNSLNQTNYAQYGNMACLNLDSFELLIQANMDK